MRYVAVAVAVLACVACTKADREAEQSAPDSTVGVRPISLAALAGTWQFRVMNANGDSVTGYQLTARADTSGWTMTLADRAPVAVRVLVVSPESVVTEVGPYASVMRAGARVWVHSMLFAYRGDRIVGLATAHYNVRTADSVAQLRMVGRRVS